MLNTFDIDLPKPKVSTTELPKYDGLPWQTQLPSQVQCWELATCKSIVKQRGNQSVSTFPWVWPEQPIYFISDVHADSEAFVASLLASGGVVQKGCGLFDYELTAEGHNGLFIIGGDCLDKGPSNLALLRAIRCLKDKGANVRLLAGNHDVRLLMGLRCLEMEEDVTSEHFFLRMGPKVVPLLKEVFEEYFTGDDDELAAVPDESECRRRLYPRDSWFDNFAAEALWLMPEKTLKKELKRMAEKADIFSECCADAGLTLRHVYATALKCKQLFLQPEGEFYWFFQDMQLLHHAGSFLFIHAGLDDRIIRLIAEEGIDHINQLYRHQIQHDLFEFYYGPLANTMRTKYRDVDMPLTPQGVIRANNMGIHAVVHGHRNRVSGQRIIWRQGMIHVEGDVTLDRNSRRKEGLSGIGMGVTIIRPEGKVIGISNDYPYAKVFEPKAAVHAS